MNVLSISRGVPALASVVIGLLALASTTSASDLCIRIDLEEPPKWVNEAVWLPEENQLVISDWRKNQIISFAADGAVIESIPFGKDQPPPYAILPYGADFLFVNGAAQVEWIDDSLQQQRHISLNLAAPKDSGWSVGGMWSKQTVVAGHSLVAMGGLRSKGRLFVGAFSIPLPSFAASSGNAEPKPIFQFKAPDGHKGQAATSSVPSNLQFDAEGVPFYLHSMKYITSIGPNAYILLLADRPAIVRYNTLTGKTDVLGGSSSMFSAGLPAPPSGTDSEQAAHLASLDNLPAGLYAQGGALFVLTRSPRGETAGTTWRLTKLIPSGNELRAEGTVVLPTTSKNISVLPTGDGWLVIEEGAVFSGPAVDASHDPITYKDVRTVVVVRNDAIDTPTSSPLAEGRFDQRRSYCRAR